MPLIYTSSPKGFLWAITWIFVKLFREGLVSTLHGLVYEGLCLIFGERRYLWSPPKFYITQTCPRGLCLVCVQRSLLRRRTLHGYLWIPPKFYITRTCPRGGHGADATDHSAVGLDQATGRPDKTEHALLAFQKAKENTYNNVKIKKNTNIDIYKHKGLFQARVRALKTEFTMMIT